MNRRNFLSLVAGAGAASFAPRWAQAEAAVPSQIAQARTAAAQTPIKTTKLYDNVYLLQGVGGNMALQTGPDGSILIDSSFATAVPKILAAVGAVTKAAPDTLINTHWHYDHTDGNEGLHAAGFGIVAHTKTRERLSTPQEVKLFHVALPADPAGSWPTITFDDSMHAWHNGDSLDLAHFSAAHTDTDIYIHFHSADVLHLGDIFFNGIYPFIDESSGGNIGGMIQASEKALALAGARTQIIPGHGPLGDKTQLQQYRDMLSTVRDNVAALKTAGASEAEAVAKKPTAALDATWGKGGLTGDVLTGIVYRTL
ncbi:MAG TPA: MBL fold metallo-hydrolase [Terracidiphilus sp.]|nr:MBL fold metallo-hydrolase [Terracidiphilus sp.]